LPFSLYGAAAFMPNDNSITICGGFQNETLSRKCFSLQNRNWRYSGSMKSPRSIA